MTRSREHLGLKRWTLVAIGVASVAGIAGLSNTFKADDNGANNNREERLRILSPTHEYEAVFVVSSYQENEPPIGQLYIVEPGDKVIPEWEALMVTNFEPFAIDWTEDAVLAISSSNMLIHKYTNPVLENRSGGGWMVEDILSERDGDSR